VVWQLVDLYKKNSTGITKKIGIWFLLSCVANIGRMFAWQYQQVRLSVIIMLFFLVVLIVIANKVQLGKRL
jgi:translocator protein